MSWRAIFANCPRCGNQIGITDYPTGIWGVSYCEKCGAKFNAYQMLKAGYEIINVSEEDAKKIKCLQSTENIQVDKWEERDLR